MHGRLYLDTMHVDRANLIMWYLLIQRSDLETEHTVVTVRISRSFLRHAMNELMHVMQLWFFGYMDGHSSHLSWLSHECKIKCLQSLFLVLYGMSFSKDTFWNDFFFLLNSHSFSHSTLSTSLSFCNYLWVYYEPFHLKGIFSGCRAFLMQRACAGRFLPRKLVARLFFGGSSCEEFHLPMDPRGSWGRCAWYWHHPCHW